MTINEVVRHGKPVQVLFYDNEDMCPGIMVGNQIVCACCGALFDVDEVIDNAREDGAEAIRMFTTWVDISSEIQEDISKDYEGTVLLEMEDN